MDYKAFYNDVYGWIMQCNQMATKYGIGSHPFWEWVMKSAGDLCEKYNNDPLTQKQMLMMIDWINSMASNKEV